MTRIINCTPHAITLEKRDGSMVTFEPSGVIPRVDMVEVEAEDIGDCMCFSKSSGGVFGLPVMIEGTFYIVSGMVFDASDRPDVIAPNTGNTAIRNNKGQIVAVRSFFRK